MQVPERVLLQAQGSRQRLWGERLRQAEHLILGGWKALAVKRRALLHGVKLPREGLQRQARLGVLGLQPQVPEWS